MTLAGMKKAIAPALLGVVAAVTSWIVTGTLDLAELGYAGAGLLTATAVYAVPNIATTPFLKALVPSFLALVAVFAMALERGELDETDLRTAAAGLVTSAAVFVLRNPGSSIYVPSAATPAHPSLNTPVGGTP